VGYTGKRVRISAGQRGKKNRRSINSEQSNTVIEIGFVLGTNGFRISAGQRGKKIRDRSNSKQSVVEIGVVLQAAIFLLSPLTSLFAFGTIRP
jgi:hypothetical protein